MSKAINLNADMGESFGAYTIGNDKALLEIVGSANIACGFHAGDPLVMREITALARDKGVSVGAHPAFPDLQGFGRRKMHLHTHEVEAMVVYQTGALIGLAQAEGTNVSHVKPHGALNNMASEDMELAQAIARAVKAVDRELILLATAGSCLSRAGHEAGLRVAEEIFADRAYGDDGHLLPRSIEGALIHDPEQSARQILSFLEERAIITATGKRIPTEIHSICVHGDNASALNIAQTVRTRLEEAGWTLAPLPAVTP